MSRVFGWVAGLWVAGAAVGCGKSDPLAGKSTKDIEAMQAAEQKQADDEEMANLKDRKKAKAGAAKK